MSPPLHVVRAGTAGPALVLVHGSATDAATWTIQLASSLTSRYRVIAYDRRGAGRSANRPGVAWHSIDDHAADLAELIAAAGPPALVAGSSCGAAVALELCRRSPALVRGAILIEPPLAPDDATPSVPPGFLVALDDLAATGGPEAAAERFLITVLGEAAWARLPRLFRARTRREWPQIRGDCYALDAYRVRYAELGAVDVPVRLLGGDRSAAYFRPTLTALAAALPRASLAIIAGAGHMLHAEAPRAFAEHVDALAAATG
ncbi:MAG: alpha/beta hydrolase [Myxococcales bacterium]|nr:alpha/beta hydrolase [Myxococcales bacterium]